MDTKDLIKQTLCCIIEAAESNADIKNKQGIIESLKNIRFLANKIRTNALQLTKVGVFGGQKYDDFTVIHCRLERFLVVGYRATTVLQVSQSDKAFQTALFECIDKLLDLLKVLRRVHYENVSGQFGFVDTPFDFFRFIAYLGGILLVFLQIRVLVRTLD